jgi:serine/threonine-protein kinase HipA
MALRELYVFAHLPEGFAPAGRLRLTEADGEVTASSFAYGRRYLERPLRFEVDPVSLAFGDPDDRAAVDRFPVNALTQFGGLRDAAPDAWGRRVVEARHRAPANSLPESTYLLEAGSDRVGALDVRGALVSPPRAGFAPLQSLDYLLETVERIELGEPIPGRLTDLLGSGAGAGGARPKATVRDADGLLWLAKFPSRSDTFDVARAEWATLQLAARCGMSVPAARVVDLGPRAVLLIRRFDRYWAAPDRPLPTSPLHETVPGSDRCEQRLPFVSGLTLIACDEFESRSRGYGDLARAIRRHCHPQVIRSDNRELFARMVFNILVSNDDDHLRNHSFLRDPRLGGWRLSPLYDVVPRPSGAFERFLHLEVGPEGKLATLDNALAASAAFSIERPDAILDMARIWREVSAWRACFEDLGLEARLIERLAPAFRVLDEVASTDLRHALQASVT